MASNPKIVFEGEDKSASSAAKGVGKELDRLQQTQERNAAAINRSVRALQQQAATLGKNENAVKLYELKLRGASDAQLLLATTALRQKAAFEATEKANAAKTLQQTAAANASTAINSQVLALEKQAAILGKTERQTKLYELTQQGATKAQLASADAALRQKEAFERTEKIASRLGPILLAGFGIALVANIRNTIAAIDDLDEAAQGLGVTAVALAEFRQAAQQAGVAPQKLDQALTNLNIKVADAISGNKEAAALFQALGIRIKEVTDRHAEPRTSWVTSPMSRRHCAKTAGGPRLFTKC